jgi:hypothetical protein
MLILCVGLLGPGAQGPATAVFAFQDGELEILFATQAPVRVEIEDGLAGQIRVEDMTRSGRPAYEFAASRLGIVHRTLAPGAYRVEVPRAARVRLSVNGVVVAILGPGAEGRRLVWSSAPAPGLAAKGPPVTVEARTGAVQPEPRLEFRVHAFAGPLVVDSVDVAHPERARTLKIRLGRRDFRVIADRSVRFGYHRPTRWGVVTVRDTAAHVEIELPAAASRFRVRVAGRTIWRLHPLGADALCEPVARVRRKDGGEDWVFDLAAGLVCRPEQSGARPA